MKVHMAVVGSPSLIVFIVSVDVRQFFLYLFLYERVEMAELRSCVKVHMAVVGSPSLIVFIVSVDVRQFLFFGFFILFLFVCLFVCLFAFVCTNVWKWQSSGAV